MKKIYFILILIFSFSNAQQYFVDFEDATKNGYASGTVELSGIDWDLTETLIGNAAADWKNGTKSARLRGYASSSLTMLANKTGGVGTLSFLYRRYGTDAQVDWKVEYSTDNGTSWTQVGNDFTAPASDDVQTFTAELNINQDIRFRIKRATEVGTSNNRLNIDDITVTDFGVAPSPSLSITAPQNNTIFNPLTTQVDVVLNISNFVVGNPGAGIDGHVMYSVNSGMPQLKYDTDPIAVNVQSGESYTVDVMLVDNSGQPLSPAVEESINFSIAEFVQVADLGALRTDFINNGAGSYYQVNSTPLVTFTRVNRNQKYIQDASGAILIDDPNGVITTTMSIGDNISGLKGQTSVFGNVLQFTPAENASVSSSNNPVIPQNVSVEAVINDVAAYESRLVVFDDVTITGGGANFAVNTNYTVTQVSETIQFRSIFGEADYIGQEKPTQAINLIGLVGRENATLPRITPRYSADFVPLSTQNFSIEGLKMYPNPVNSNEVLNVSSASNNPLNIEIFNIVGKKVLTANQNQISVGQLQSGVYMVKVTDRDATETLKLLVK